MAQYIFERICRLTSGQKNFFDGIVGEQMVQKLFLVDLSADN
jgi:hypothetical protein